MNVWCVWHCGHHHLVVLFRQQQGENLNISFDIHLNRRSFEMSWMLKVIRCKSNSIWIVSKGFYLFPSSTSSSLLRFLFWFDSVRLFRFCFFSVWSFDMWAELRDSLNVCAFSNHQHRCCDHIQLMRSDKHHTTTNQKKNQNEFLFFFFNHNRIVNFTGEAKEKRNTFEYQSNACFV